MSKRHHRKKQAPAIRNGELATPERRHQLGGVETEIVDRDAAGKAYIKRHKAKLECVLDYYWRAQRISDAQHAAGIKFREIYTRVAIGANGKIGELLVVDNGQGDTERTMVAHIDCLRLLDNARKQLSAAQDEIIIRVCCHDEFAGHSESKKTLDRALDVLAKHWGFI